MSTSDRNVPIADRSQAYDSVSTWRRDSAVVLVLTFAVAGLAIVTNFSEALYDATRRFEHLQLDELPVVLWVLACGLIWFAWRRHREMLTELGRRHRAEHQLAALLRENRRLVQQNVDTQESERKRFARELHDEAGQYLNAIKTYAVTIQSAAATDPIRRAAAMLVEHADRAYEAVRTMIRQLRPVGLDELGLKAALEHLVEQTQTRVPTLELEATCEGDLDALSEPLALTIYRLAQEGLTNAMKHARAKRVDLRVVRSFDAGQIEFRLADDGRGCDRESPSRGFGLIGLRERVDMLGGTFRVESAPSQGFAILASIPVGEGAAA